MTAWLLKKDTPATAERPIELPLSIDEAEELANTRQSRDFPSSGPFERVCGLALADVDLLSGIRRLCGKALSLCAIEE